ncbi:sugar-binding domain protein [Acetobacteraceae bacterium AT-5844]|nr:sugar-binding domain protein [Acetobacteraceae bacterium AT-5844]
MSKNDPRITLTEVARHAGVSRATVSLVMRDSPLVAAETRARVQASAEAVGYLYNRGAATMRGQRTRTIGLLVTEIDNPFFSELVAGAEAALDAAGYIAFLATTADSLDRQQRTLQRLREHRVDGLILCAAGDTTAEHITTLASQGMPCVQAMRQVRGSTGDFAGADNRFALEQLTEHLIRLGHRRMIFAGAAVMNSSLIQRLEGLRAALRRHGLPAPAVLRTPATRLGGAEAAEAVWRMAEKPDVVVCCNDVVALGAIPALQRLGARVGEDIAVTGVGDVPEAANGNPPLTTVATDPRRIGQEAVRLLLRRIAHPSASAEQVILPARLVIRASCGAMAHLPAGAA